MNFLAHAVLSYTDEQIAGQFLQDFIRNQDRFSYPEKIQQGIFLHREIDTFTDAHPEIHNAKKIFSPTVRLYAGAFVDVAMDYFLANSFSELELTRITQKTYDAFRNFKYLFPEELNQMCQSMEKDNWLFNYRHHWAIQKAMGNVLNRAKYLEKNLPVFEIFLQNKTQLQLHFDRFYPDLQNHTIQVNADLQKRL